MPKIKNVLAHPDDLHDGRPLDPYSTVEISRADLQLEHYQSRLRDGLIVLVEEEPDPELQQLKVPELRDRAERLGIDTNGLKKADLIKAVQTAEAADTDPQSASTDADTEETSR